MALPLVQLPAFAHGGPFTAGRPLGVAVHCTESDNNPGTAEALAGPGWFGGAAAGTSAHKIVDRDSICEGVKRTTVAYHAGPSGNSYFLAYEFCGRASWSAAQWRQPEQLAMLRNAAPHIADDLRYCNAPARWLSVVQVAQLQRGMMTHNDIRLAFPGTTTHTDPGPNFPYAELLALVAAELSPAPAAPEPAFPIGGSILAAFTRSGGLAVLGQPRGPEVPTGDKVGRWQEFANGAAFWHPRFGGPAWTVSGDIARLYATLGREAGFGWPITDEQTCPDKVGRYNHFDGGRSIYWTPTTRAVPIGGAIRAAWGAGGWETGRLGYPTGPERPAEGGIVQTFQRGSILWAEGSARVRADT